jgi:hypothetical protein
MRGRVVNISRWPIPPHVEAAARAMSTRERVDYLKAHGWYRFDSHGSQRWGFDGWVYSLAAAVRAQLENDPNLERARRATDAT